MPRLFKRELDIELRTRRPRRATEPKPRWVSWSTAGLARSRGRGTSFGVRSRSEMQRSVVKVSYSANTKSGMWKAHGRYLAREGAQRENGKGLGFDAERSDLDISSLAGAWQEAGDSRLWRLIV